MLNKLNREPNFIEKRRQWKGDLDKPVRRRTLLMILPALIMCVFVVMSAPYLKMIVETVFELNTEIDLKVINLEDAPEAKERQGPPADAEELEAQRIREELAAQGIDWENPPMLPALEPRLVEPRSVVIEMPPLNLPNTMAGLEAARAQEP